MVLECHFQVHDASCLRHALYVFSRGFAFCDRDPEFYDRETVIVFQHQDIAMGDVLRRFEFFANVGYSEFT